LGPQPPQTAPGRCLASHMRAGARAMHSFVTSAAWPADSARETS
jgi:hypothetical protein